MKALPVIIGIVIILALVSLPGAAMISKDDLLASYPPSHDRASMMAWVRGPVRCGDCTPEPWSKGTVTPAPTPIPTPTPVLHDSADDSDCSECREPCVYNVSSVPHDPDAVLYGCGPPPPDSGNWTLAFPPTPTVEGSMKVTERHVPQLPPYIPSWVTL